MGNGAFSCCDVTSSKLNEISINTTCKAYPHAFNLHDQDLNLRIKLLETLTSGKTLLITVLNTGFFPKGRTFIIKPQGYEDSLRVPKDGCTYFGCTNENECSDIYISPEEAVVEESQRGRNFIIYYKIEKDSYWIRDLGRGYGAFIKVEALLV